MKRKYVKQKHGETIWKILLQPFYKVIYFFILFFIFIGDSVIFFLSTTFRGIYILSKLIWRNLVKTGKTIHATSVSGANGCMQLLRTLFLSLKSAILIAVVAITSVRLPKITLPTITFPKVAAPSIQLPRVTLPQIHLPKFSFPKVSISIPQVSIKLPKRGRGRPRKSKWSLPQLPRPLIWIPTLPAIQLPGLPHVNIPFITARIRYFFLGTVVTLIVVFVYQSYIFVKALPHPRLIGSINYPLSTHLYDRNGQLLYEIYRDQNRTPIKLKDLPPYVSQAAIAIEDKDFEKHNGISIYSGILRAVKDMIREKNLQGGSTITQQLVKSALLTPERTIERKVKEIILALWAEQLYTKAQIMEMYVNQVPYGGSAYGIEEASKTYFGKSAKDLILDEAALLAGLPQAPSLYSPYSDPEAAIWRRNDVLRKMKEQGYITDAQMKKAIATKPAIVPLATNIKAPHFVFYVKQQLEETYGSQRVEEGGMRVTTSLDLKIQAEAEKILKEELEKVKHLNISNGGIVVTRPSTGEILAMVGSVDYFATPSGAFNVTTALRQPGSSIKPITYSLALERGYTAASIIDDSPVSYAISASEVYRPVNYDGKFHGKVPFRMALANSYNITAVRILNSVGVKELVNYAENMGISTWKNPENYGLSLTLGGGEVTMVDMATAFGVFANRGYKTELNSIISMENAHGDTIYEIDPTRDRVVTEGNAYIISDILSDNFARQWAFGAKSQLEIPGYKVAVKTGTTDNKKDNWTIGYTPEYLVAVWVGNNNNQPMHPTLASGVTGAAPIWNRTMSYVLKTNNASPNAFRQPETVTERVCFFGRREVFVAGTESSAFCNRKLLETQNPSTKPKPIN